MHELKPDQFDRARALFEPFDYSLSIRAAILGNNPGRIFVDDMDQPRTALALTVEGYFLAGDPQNAATITALGKLFKERIFTGEVFVNGNDAMSLALHPESWEARLPELVPTHEAGKNLRYHYLCRKVELDWRSRLPPGYTLRRVDQALLDDPQIVFADELTEFFDPQIMWGSLDNFLRKGISYCILHGQEVAAWCCSDCTDGEQIDIGIVTHRAHRRKGLAAIAAAATVEECLRCGYQRVGWHCNFDNDASWKTAEKVGFKRNREYYYYDYMFDLADHFAVLAWFCSRQGKYDQTAAYYERAFALRAERLHYDYHLAAVAWAALGNRQKALQYLDQAATRGWRHAEYTRQLPEFGILHDAPEWELILAKMKRNAESASA